MTKPTTTTLETLRAAEAAALAEYEPARDRARALQDAWLQKNGGWTGVLPEAVKSPEARAARTADRLYRIWDAAHQARIRHEYPVRKPDTCRVAGCTAPRTTGATCTGHEER